MRKKLYKAKKNWVVGLIAGALLLFGGSLSASADTTTANQPSPITTQTAQVSTTSSLAAYYGQGLNLYDSDLVGVNGYEGNQLATDSLDSNVQVSTKGDTYDSGSHFPRTVNSSRGILINRGSTTQYYYINRVDSGVDYLEPQDPYQKPVTGISVGTGFISKTSYGNPANIVENTLGQGTISNNDLQLTETNTMPMPAAGGSNHVTINKHVTTQGNTFTNTVSFSASGDVTQPGAFGIEIRPEWFPDDYATVDDQDHPYILGNCFYYIIKDSKGDPAWVEVLQPLNGTRMFSGNKIGAEVDPILGGRKLTTGMGYPVGSYLYMTAPAGLNASLSYRESYYSIKNYNRGDMNNYGNLDGYSLRQNNQGQAVLHVSGWHASNVCINQPSEWLILYDNTTNREVARQKVTNPGARPDVAAAFPQVINSYNSGFSADFTLPTNMIGHQFTVIARYSDNATSGEGSNSDLWLHPFTFNHGNFANLDGVQVSNNQLKIIGWHATNLALGRNYHYIIVLSNGREVGRQLVRNGQSRNDVANVYGDVLNAARSGFNVNLNLNPAMANGNLQIVSRWTDDPAGNGNATDYWFAPIDMGNNQGNLDSASINGNRLTVSGWNATNASMVDQHHTLILFDNTTNSEVQRITVYNSSRPDVARAFAGIRTAGQSGFNGTFQNVNLQSGHRYSLISRYSFTSDSNHNFVDHWFNLPANIAPQASTPSSPVSTDNGNYAHLDDFSHGDASVFVSGWHASNQARNMKYHYIIILNKTTGQEVARKLITDNTSRPDVQRAYPGVANAGQSGFNIHLQDMDYPLLNTLFNPGAVSQIISRWTNDPAGNGNSVDYYFAPTHLFP